jgi:hypothetical protein
MNRGTDKKENGRILEKIKGGILEVSKGKEN